MPGRISFEVELGAARPSADRLSRGGEPLRILVLGDFSGRHDSTREAAVDFADRAPCAVDLDSFDAAFRRMAPALTLGEGGNPDRRLALRFDTYEDFHPDSLYVALEPFRALRESRARLVDPATFEQEAARLMQSQPPATATDGTGAPYGSSAAEPESDLMQRLIGARPEPAAPAAATGAVDALIRRLVQPHVTAASSRSAEPYLAALDASIAELMRSLLHDREFQSLESSWRGVRRFVDTVELGESVTLHIVDVGKGELLADLAASGGNPLESAAFRLLARAGRAVDGPQWSLLVGMYQIGANSDDLALLGHLGVIASHAGAPLLAGASADLVGCPRLGPDAEARHWAYTDTDIERRWQALRHSPVAGWLALAMPRILLRLPYGAKADPIDGFAFEEMPPATSHEDFLWGNPALACAQAVAAAWVDAGGKPDSLAPLEIEDLPAYVRDVDGERRLQPCAEFVLPVRIGEELLQRGIVPLLSYGNRNAVRIAGVRSIAEPPASLVGMG